MTPWPALCTLVAIAALLVLIIRYQFQAFVALLVVSLGLGLAAGMKPEAVLAAMGKGVGDILREVAIILALGSLLGRMLEASGGALVIARTLVRWFGTERASLAILLAAYIVGIPVLFNVGFLLLIPIMWRLQRETGKSLLWFAMPMTFSLATAHSLIPPHPGIIGAVNTMGGDMVQTILFGTLMGFIIVVAGWLGPGRWWAARQFVTVPEALAAKEEGKGQAQAAPEAPPSFFLSVAIVTMPLVLSLVGFGVKLLADLKRLPEWMLTDHFPAAGLPVWFGIARHRPVDWLQFLGHPTMALLVPTGLSFWLLGARRGLGQARLAKVAADAINDIGAMALLFGGAGAFKQVIQDSGAGDYIARVVLDLPLSPVAVAFFTAVLMRAVLGSATAAILTASALLAGVARSLPGQETLLVLAVANGVTFMTQPGDSGFWLVKEYCNLSVKDTLLRYNLCRAAMALFGLGLLLIWEAAFG